MPKYIEEILQDMDTVEEVLTEQEMEYFYRRNEDETTHIDIHKLFADIREVLESVEE